MDNEQTNFSPSAGLTKALEFQLIGDIQSAEKIYRNITEIFQHQLSNLMEGEEVSRSDIGTFELGCLAKCFNNIGIIYKNSDRLEEAKRSFIKAIEINPKFENAYNNLGNLYFREDDFPQAEVCFREALKINPNYSDALNNLGNVFKKIGRLNDAEHTLLESISINPRQIYAQINLGLTLLDQDRPNDAELRFRQAVLIDPSLAVPHFHLANVSRDLGKLSEAENSYRTAISIDPKFLAAYSQFGKFLFSIGRFQCAENCYRAALEISPNSIELLNNLGVVLFKNSKLADAEDLFLQAIKIDPKFSDVYINLGKLYFISGAINKALDSALAAFSISKKHASKLLIAKCFSATRMTDFLPEIAELATQALDETWIRPVQMVMFAQELLLQQPRLRKYIDQTLNVSDFIDLHDFFNLLSSEPLLDNLFYLTLTSAPLSSVPFEQFLTTLRRHILMKEANKKIVKVQGAEVLRFLSILAQQCYINEYVYAYTEEEQEIVALVKAQVSDRLARGETVSEDLILLVACYESLSVIPHHENLLGLSCSKSLQCVIEQQIREPQIELALRAAVPRLTNVEDDISLAVQGQYEENPYPRWVRLPKVWEPKTINQRIRDLFPHSDFTPLIPDLLPAVLIAGCGTGQQPIEVACLLQSSDVLAVDLSMASLTYAKRKALESCVNNISFAQADILKLGELNRKFDVIEAGGVLHHMRDPFAAWDILLGLLKPNGLMKLGLYSSIARRHVVGLREMIAKAGLGQSRSEIAAFRQKCLQGTNAREYGWAVRSPDFFSTSGCRDLLFHVHEHRMTLPLIEQYLKQRGLKFLGFEMDHSIILAYQHRFPGDKAATVLSNWDVFEKENPDIFQGMYQFWIQKI